MFLAKGTANAKAGAGGVGRGGQGWEAAHSLVSGAGSVGREPKLVFLKGHEVQPKPLKDPVCSWTDPHPRVWAARGPPGAAASGKSTSDAQSQAWGPNC